MCNFSGNVRLIYIYQLICIYYNYINACTKVINLYWHYIIFYIIFIYLLINFLYMWENNETNVDLGYSLEVKHKWCSKNIKCTSISYEISKLIDIIITRSSLDTIPDDCKNAFDVFLKEYISKLLWSNRDDVKESVKCVIDKYKSSDEIDKSIKRIDLHSPSWKIWISIKKWKVLFES